VTAKLNALKAACRDLNANVHVCRYLGDRLAITLTFASEHSARELASEMGMVLRCGSDADGRSYIESSMMTDDMHLIISARVSAEQEAA
jgi:hypothetical protein